ncbi:hypothetical protein TGCAST_390160, partial [Toxoplasma gondii CAST]
FGLVTGPDAASRFRRWRFRDFSKFGREAEAGYWMRQGWLRVPLWSNLLPTSSIQFAAGEEPLQVAFCSAIVRPSDLLGSPVSPSPKLLERYRAAYRSTVDKKRQEMSALEQSIHQAQVEEAQLRALLFGRRSKGGEAPAEPGTEGHPPPSTSTAQSEGEKQVLVPRTEERTANAASSTDA